MDAGGDWQPTVNPVLKGETRSRLSLLLVYETAYGGIGPTGFISATWMWTRSNDDDVLLAMNQHDASGWPNANGRHFRHCRVAQFFEADFMPMNKMCERAEMFEKRIYDSSKAVFDYLGLPFESGGVTLQEAQ